MDRTRGGHAGIQASATEQLGKLPPRPAVDLEVIVPAYNEEGRLSATLAGIVDYLARQPYRSAVVVVDNGSVDRTADIVAAASASLPAEAVPVPVHVIGCSRQGKGAAVRWGVLTSQARFVGFSDADLATPIETLDRIVPCLERGDAVVVGSRRCPGARYEVEQSLVRRLGSSAFGEVARRIVPAVADTQCGFKFFQSAVARHLFSQCSVDGFAFDVEVLALAERLGYPVTEVPVLWSDKEGSTFSGRRHAQQVLAEVLRIGRRLRQPGRLYSPPSPDRLSELAGMRVLFLNWRDHKHPRAGGAEVYCWELARRFAAAGARVTLFTSRPEGAPAVEEEEGVRIERRGGATSLYLHAAWYLLRHRRRFDAVVDCQNGIPFFTPLFAHRWSAVVCAIHHVHQDQFGVHFRWPLSWVGRVLERDVSRVVYGHRPLVAVSPSTRAAVRRRLGLRGPIFIVPNGAPPVAGEPVGPEPVASERSATPTIACVGRLVAHKRMELLLEAMGELLPRWPELRLEIAGDGPDRPRLERLARRLGVEHAVRFHGYVAPEAKAALLASAWLTVNPSMGEGWGLGVIEANAQGVPALACRVPGLADSIRPGVTGGLVADEQGLAAGIGLALETLADPAEARRWAERCRQWAARFSWDASARRLAGIVCAELARPKQERRRANRTDLATIAVFEVDDPEAFSRLAARRLRRSDLWSISGTTVHLLLHGADEADAQGVLERIGVHAATEVRVALSHELLVGPGAGVVTWPERREEQELVGVAR